MTLDEIKAAIGIKPYFEDGDIGVIYHADCLDILPRIPEKAIDLCIVDPPYQEGNVKIFPAIKNSIKINGQILWFTQPSEIYDLPEKPKQILVWQEPISPKPIHKKYLEFLDFIAWYADDNYTFNPILWNLMASQFEDRCIGYNRIHKWEKPATLMQRFLLVHSNPLDIILDSFAGSFTACVAAKQLGRKYIGIEISEKYCKIGVQRLAQTVMDLPTPKAPEKDKQGSLL